MTDFDFNKIIDEYISSERESDKKELIISKYSASMLGACVRQNYYNYTDPQDFDTEKLKIFEMGNVVHDWVAKVLSKTPSVKFVTSEKELALEDFESGLLISGRLDDLILLKKSDGSDDTVVVEVKSAKSLEYIIQPKYPHVLQLMVYLRVLSHYGVKEGVIIYVDKNTLNTKTFKVAYDHNILLDAVKRARTLHKYLVEKTLPPAAAKIDPLEKWQCKFCGYADQCNKDGLK